MVTRIFEEFCRFTTRGKGDFRARTGPGWLVGLVRKTLTDIVLITILILSVKIVGEMLERCLGRRE